MVDYIVTEEDVTAHREALEITESQITDLQDYLTNKNSVGELSDVYLPTKIEDGKILKYYDHLKCWGVADDLGITQETDPFFRFSEANNITDAGSGAVITDDERSKLAGYEVGDFAHGGVVFYVEPCGTKGLICAKEDQSEGVRWYAGGVSKFVLKRK